MRLCIATSFLSVLAYIVRCFLYTTAMRHDGNWILVVDDIEKSQRVDSELDVQLNNKEAFIGGRPGHEYECLTV